MRILLAIFTCHRYSYEAEGYRDWFVRTTVDRVPAIRDTWLKDVTVDYKFFYGRGPRSPLPDEVFLDCNDDYHHSYEKIKGIVRWALAHGYDYVFKVDDDVWVNWDKLDLNPTADYIGWGSDFACGFTYWLSRRALEVLDKSGPGEWAEDRWVGEALKKRGIKHTNDHRYYFVTPTKTNQYISDEELDRRGEYLLTIHALSPEQMRRHYRRRSELQHNHPQQIP